MKKDTLTLVDEKAQLKKRAFDMIENCKIEIRDLTEEENKEITSIKIQIEDINKELRE